MPGKCAPGSVELIWDTLCLIANLPDSLSGTW